MSTPETVLNINAVAKRIKSLMPRYLERLKEQDSEDYTGAFQVFEEDTVLFELLFSYPYISRYLDYDYLCGILHFFIVHNEIHDPVKAAELMNEQIIGSKEHLDWVAVYPINFVRSLGSRFGKRKVIEGSHIFGRFTLSEPQESHSALENFIREGYGVDHVDQSAYLHQSEPSDQALKKLPLLSFKVHGSDDARALTASTKLRYFCSLFEVFAVYFDAKEGMKTSHETNVHHGFFINKMTGDIDRTPLTKPTQMSFDPVPDFIQTLKDNDFSYFSELVFHSNDTLFKKLRSALYFFSKGLNGSDDILNFISYVIAIEAIFSKDKNNPIKITLSEHIAILCYPPEERFDIFKRIKAIYDERSKIVHSGQFDLSQDMIRQAREIAATAIYHCFLLYRELKAEESDNKKIEGLFFQKLQHKRLGII
ncbi:hypothetical protein [Pseudomonas sp. NPDC096950]|uniref:hypothetical protein n=1 Tax=Pseudomonas sp. NPDC096950 TaxID=3364485 RepID=UPI00383B9749